MLGYHSAVLALRDKDDGSTIEQLIQALGDSDSDVKWHASQALAKIGAPAVEPLIQALSDRDSNVRQYAVLALGNIGDTSTIEQLIQALGDSDSDVKWYAIQALAKIGAPAVEPLVQALSDNSICGNAVLALGSIGDARAIGPLIRMLGSDNNDIQRVAAEALRRIGDGDLPRLILLSQEMPMRNRVAALRALLGNNVWHHDLYEHYPSTSNDPRALCMMMAHDADTRPAALEMLAYLDGEPQSL